MIHPHTELRFISPEKGFGVVATQRIPKGTITWALDRLDRILTPEAVASLPDAYRPIVETYAFRDGDGDYILCWDHGRYVNHSFNSNCLTTAYDFELAIRDIEAGEELTDDYGYLNIESEFTPLAEKGSRRKVVRPDDVLRHSKTWDRKLRDAFKQLEQVNQPLWDFVRDDSKSRALRVARGQETMVSIKQCYFNQAG